MSTDLPATLADVQLETARLLAREGNREVIIRKTLHLNERQWKAIRDADDSPLADALEHGRAEGLAEVVTFMKRMMQERGSLEAAKWIAARLYGETEQGEDRAPRVIVNIGTPMSPEEYRRVIDVQPDALPGPR